MLGYPYGCHMPSRERLHVEYGPQWLRLKQIDERIPKPPLQLVYSGSHLLTADDTEVTVSTTIVKAWNFMHQTLLK